MKNIKNLFHKLTNTKHKKIVFSFVSICLVFLLCFGLSKTNFVRNLLKMAGIYTQEEKMIEFYSDGWEENEPGSIHVTKSADWVSEDTAEIIFDVESKVKSDIENVDVILAVDNSDRDLDSLAIYKNKLQEFVADILTDSSNKISIINFSYNSSNILVDFTNDIETVNNKIDTIGSGGASDYYQGLLMIEELLSTYTKESNRDVVVLFIVDGFNYKHKAYAEYDVIKDKYSYVNINGIQLDMGDNIYSGLLGCTDKQYIATMDNLPSILSRAALDPYYYESIELTDYINKDFYIESENDIEVPIGDVELSEDDGTQKVTWSIGADELLSGSNTTLSMKLHLDSKYHEIEDYYAVGNKTSIVYNFTNEESITTTSSNTPVLKNGYKVVYDANPPTGCNITSLREEVHYAYNNVKKSIEVPICDGYEFGGWEIVTENVEQVNETEFIMPSSNVDIKGTWKKLDISISMQGSIYEKPTLYETIMYQSRGTDLENNIDFTNISSDTNGKGVYTFSGTENDEYPIYYYRGDVKNNNVLFANFCWKIVRTTETGGVKLIYNGVPTNGTCNNTGTASQLDSTSAFNSANKSLAYGGYMYGAAYTTHILSMSWNNLYPGRAEESNNYMAGTNYIYGKEVEYSSSNGYSIVDGDYHSWDSRYQNLKGYYTCGSEYGACSRIYYITDTSSTTMTYVQMSSGQTYAKAVEYLNNNPFIIAKDITYANGIYTLKNTKSVNALNWSTEYNKLGEYRYYCPDRSTSCEEVYYIWQTNDTEFYRVLLNSGASIEEALVAMTSGSTNTTSSTIKIAIDTWYEANMTSYTKYIEDTIWCNDRTIADVEGWDKSKETIDSLKFNSYKKWVNLSNPNLDCPNEADRFSVSNKKAKLTYPVGLLTRDEIRLAGGDRVANSSFYLYSGQDYWLMSPGYFHRYYIFLYTMQEDGKTWPTVVSPQKGVRPSISIKGNLYYSDGHGTVDQPYVIETN